MIPTNVQVSAVSGGGLEPPTVHAQQHIVAGQRLALGLSEGLSSLSVYSNRTLRVPSEGHAMTVATCTAGQQCRRPTGPGYCANCGDTPCRWVDSDDGTCWKHAQPFTPEYAVSQIMVDAEARFPTMAIHEIMAMICNSQHNRTRLAMEL